MSRLLLALSLAAALAGCAKTLVCPSGETDCDGQCRALDGDPTNCGACGHACGAQQACTAGACTCAEGATACGTACVDPAIDPQDCGTCGVTCGGATPLCAGAGPGCVAACPGGTTQCGSACADLQASPSHCGACDHACAAGQSCIHGTCGAPLYAACYWTNEVKPLRRSLAYGGPRIDLGAARPSKLAVTGTTLLAAAGQPQASLSFASVSGAAPYAQVQLPGSDLEGVALLSTVALVTNAWAGTLEIIGGDGTVLDEVALGYLDPQFNFPNPLGVAASGSDAYVALNAVNKVARVDLSALAACRADAGATACGTGGTCADGGRRCVGNLCKLKCGDVANVIDLTAVPGATDGAGAPLPSAVAAANGKVYVTLSNLEFGHVTCDGFSYDWWSRPAGPGRLAEIDPANADTVAIVNLGAGCKSPSAVQPRGSTLWVSCGAYCWADLAPGAVVPVDVSGAPAVGTPLPLRGPVGGAVALCGADAYVADQRKTGTVVRFDPTGATTAVSAPVRVCGADTNGNTLVSDVACFQ